ncbi:MAG: DUF359 domain-containing protein [Candidatus Bathyarchaeia archaeon]
MAKLILTEELRRSLKNPLGKLLPGSGPEIYEEISTTFSLKKPPRVIFVGDAVTRNALAKGIRRDIMIIDNREKRAQTKPLDAHATRIFRVRNDPGTIGSEAWAAVEEAVESGDAMMIVDGEEDLLTLVAMAVAPLGSFVIYGQPDEGLVLVEVDDSAKKRACSFLESMTRTD